MSREIDLTKRLSEEDEQYLRDRGRLADIARANGEDPTEAGGAANAPLSGVTVGGAGLNPNDNSAGAASVRAAAALASMGGASPDDDSPEGAVARKEYGAKGVKKAHLEAEIDRRNAGRDEDAALAKGTVTEMVAALEDDDEENES